MNFDAGSNGNILGTVTYPHVRLHFNKMMKDVNVFVEYHDVPLAELAEYLWFMDTAQRDLPTLYANIHKNVHITRLSR